MSEVEKKSLLLDLRVLYIEDEEFTRNELSMYLKRRVGQLFTAKDGKEGFELYSEVKPDLILTDLRMPIMNGIELIEAVRKTGSSCPVIVISALSDTETIIKTVDLGIIKYVIKPVNTHELIENMETLAEGIIKSMKGRSHTQNQKVLSRDEKVEAEKKIKSAFANFLKTTTGKGPKDIHVFVKSDEIEIDAMDVLTLFEMGLLNSGKNYGLVDHNRRIFYEENRKELEVRVYESSGIRVNIEKVQVDSKANRDLVLLGIRG